MKKLSLTLLFCSTVFCAAHAQQVVFANKEFEGRLLRDNTINTNGDEIISLQEAQATDTLFVDGFYKDLGGIEAFVNLEYLSLTTVQVKTFNANQFPRLKSLSLLFSAITDIQMDQLASLQSFTCIDGLLETIKTPASLQTLYSSSGALQTIDITASTSLKQLRLSAKPTFRSIDISHNTQLEILSLFGITLESIDLSFTPKIQVLRLASAKMKSLDVSMLPDLAFMDSRFNPDLSLICVKDLATVYRLNHWKDSQQQLKACNDLVEPVSCTGHVGLTSACDDFKDADPLAAGVQEYTALTDKVKWENGAPVANEYAYRGLFWAGSTDKGFQAATHREGDGVLQVSVTQQAEVYEPFMLLFGSYTDRIQEKKFTVDLSKNKTLSFDFKNKGNVKIFCHVELEDIHGHSLTFDKALDQDRRVLHREISFWNNENMSAPGELSHFYYDFSYAICGKLLDEEGDVEKLPAPEIVFDYTQVAMVKFFFYGERDRDGEVMYDLIDQPIEIANLHLGKELEPNGLETEAFSSQDVYYKAFDLLGNFVGEGKEHELPLQAHTIYILKSKYGSKKKIRTE